MTCLKVNVFWEIIFHLKSIGTEKHMWTSVFYRYEHIYTHRRQEFQNVIEIKLCNCFGQSLLFYWTVKA